MAFDYLKALLADFKDGIERALDGLEQSHRWDVLKGVQANIEAAIGQVLVLEGAMAEGVSHIAGLSGELKAMGAALEQRTEAYDQLTVDFQSLKTKADALEAALADAQKVEPAADPVAEPVAEQAAQ